MKFDVVIMNPPYQELKKGNKKSKAIWHGFVEKSLDILKNNGHLCAIHPSRWRKPKSKIGETIRKKQIHYLEMHGFKDGKNTFGCYTDYDWYILQNTTINSITKICDCNRVLCELNLSSIPFLPNSNIKEVLSLVAKNREEKVNILWNCTYHTQLRNKRVEESVEFLHSYSAYETRKPHVSKEQTDEFKYPCVYTVCRKKIGLWYSNKKGQFFGVPKVIWGNGKSKVIIDKEGKYGLTQFAYGITDKVEFLPLIQKALLSERFIKDIMGYTTGGGHIYDKNIISLFRKDFWKEFI